jgi:hypothetical protein
MRKAQQATNQRSISKLSAGLVAVSTTIIQKAIAQDMTLYFRQNQENICRVVLQAAVTQYDYL